MTWHASLPTVWKIADTPCLVTDGNQCGERAVSTASTAICVLPSVLFLKPTGIDSPDASSRCTWLSAVRAPIATHEVRSAMCCGICVSRNSDPVGSPRSLTSSSSWRASRSPLLMWKLSSRSGSLIRPFQPTDGARLLEVGPHHDDQARPASRSAIGFSRRAYSSAAAVS